MNSEQTPFRSDSEHVMVYKTTTDPNKTHFLGGIWKGETFFSHISGTMMIRFEKDLNDHLGDTKEFVWPNLFKMVLF